MKKKAMVIASAFLGLLTLAAFPQPASAAKKKGTIKVTSMTTVTDKKGNGLEKYRGKSANLLFDEKAKTVNYYGIRYVKSGKSVRAFYDIGHGGYVPADSAILINGKPAIALNSNSYVYNSKLKRTGKKDKVYQPLIYAGKVKYSKKRARRTSGPTIAAIQRSRMRSLKFTRKSTLKSGKTAISRPLTFSLSNEKN